MKTLRAMILTASIFIPYLTSPSVDALAKDPQTKKESGTSGCCGTVVLTQTQVATETTTTTCTNDFFCPSFAMMDFGSYKTWVGSTGCYNSDPSCDCFTMMVDIAGNPPYGGDCAGNGDGCVALSTMAPAPAPATTTTTNYTLMGKVGYPYGKVTKVTPTANNPPIGNPVANGKVTRNFIPGLNQIIRFEYIGKDTKMHTIDAQIFVANLKFKGQRAVAGRGTEIVPLTKPDKPHKIYKLGDAGEPVPDPGSPYRFYYAVRINPNFTIHVPIIMNNATQPHNK